ncbi:hypothetical protein, partial [Lactobacillus delbrueckii]|uniref:hypothetical protein n=1 Tax=Lactobacillus delbrueckii TaxID=1584 RepID=UPI001E29F7D4
ISTLYSKRKSVERLLRRVIIQHQISMFCCLFSIYTRIYTEPFPKAVAVRNTNDFYFQPQLNKLRMAAPESLRSIYIPKLGLDSYLIHIDSVPGWRYSHDPLKIDYIYLISDNFESDVDLLTFIQYLLAQATLSDSSYVTTLVHIFNLLQAPPFLVDIRNHEKMFQLLHTHHLPTY